MEFTEYTIILDEMRKPKLEPVKQCTLPGIYSIGNPHNVAMIADIMYDAGSLPEEHVWMLAVNTKNIAIGIFEVAHGQEDRCYVTPREAFERALLCGASGIILIHNHPSGDPTPSCGDDIITKTMAMSGRLISVELLDHVIVGSCGFYSYKQSCEHALKDTD